MSNLVKLPTWEDEKHQVINCVVETPRGSSAKFSYDPDLKLFRLSKPLLPGLTYPYDWGFIPSTRAPDGDPMDVMMLHEVATFPGMLLCGRLVGALALNDIEDGKKTPNHRIFVVPLDTPTYQNVEDARQLPKKLKKGLEAFFNDTAQLGDKEIEILDWLGPKRALELIDEAIVSS